MKLPNYNKSKIWVDLFDQMNIYTIRKFNSPKYVKSKNEARRIELKKGISIKNIKDVEQSINPKIKVFKMQKQDKNLFSY